MSKLKYGVESSRQESQGEQSKLGTETPVKEINRVKQNENSFKPNMKLLHDAIRKQMSMEDLVIKYAQSPTNLVAKIRISLKLLATLVNKEVISEYLTDLNKMLEYRPVWLDLMDKFVYKDNFDSLPVEDRFYKWYEALEHQEQMEILNRLEKLAYKNK